jgi:hypothetical protein
VKDGGKLGHGYVFTHMDSYTWQATVAFDQTCQNRDLEDDVGSKRVFGPVVGTCYLGICLSVLIY